MRKTFSILKLAISLYFFIFSIELIKKTAIFLSKDLTKLFAIFTSPYKAFSLGWLTTAIVQSSGTVSSIGATFVGIGVLSLGTAVYIFMGCRIGTTITGLIVSLLSKAKKGRDFRHGFEIAMTNGLYNLFVIIPIFLVELFTGIFNKIGLTIGKMLEGVAFISSVPNIIDFICGPLINLVFKINSKIFFLLLGFLILFLSINSLANSVLKSFGGEKEARKIINKYFNRKWKSFLIGLLITSVLFSTSITVSLLVPLAVARVINLRKAIPYIIGANIGTATDTILAAFITGKSYAISSSFLYLLFAIVGSILWLPNINFLFNVSKYISKKVLRVSRIKAVIYFVLFLAIPFFILIL